MKEGHDPDSNTVDQGSGHWTRLLLLKPQTSDSGAGPSPPKGQFEKLASVEQFQFKVVETNSVDQVICPAQILTIAWIIGRNGD